MADRLHCADSAAVGLNRLVLLPGRGQDATGLPMPAIQRFGSIDLLCGKHCSARQVEGFGELSSLFIQLTKVAERIRFCGGISDASGEGRRLLEELLRSSAEQLLVRPCRSGGETSRKV